MPSCCASGTCGPTTTLPYTRPEGFAWGGLTIQGARTTDSASGQWTTPDAYAGDIHDPMSRKAFMWDRNNPYEYSDPSGYFIIPRDNYFAKRIHEAIWNLLNWPVPSSWPRAPGFGCTCSDGPQANVLDSRDSSKSTGADLSKASSTGKLQGEIERGRAPKGIDRADKGRGPFEQDHVHFDNGAALNKDGTWKHGSANLNAAQKDWLQSHGWTLPAAKP